MNQFQLPNNLKIGKFSSEQITEIILAIVPKRAKIILVADNFVYQKYGRKIISSLSPSTSQIEHFEINEGSIVESIDLAKLVIEVGYQYIIGIGGGKALDVSKFAANMSKINFLSIPTVAANDGISSPIAVLKGDSGRTKSLGAKVPHSIIISTEIIKEAPEIFLKAGIGDILSNLTALYDWRLANINNNDSINDFAALISRAAYESIINSAHRSLENDDFIVQILESLVLSGIAMEIAGSSRPCSGSEHLFSHALDFYFPNSRLHGLQVALGSVVSAKLQGQNQEQLITLLRDLTIDVSPRALNISEEQFCYAWKSCQSMRPDRYTVLNTISLSNETLIDIYNDINKRFEK